MNTVRDGVCRKMLLMSANEAKRVCVPLCISDFVQNSNVVLAMTESTQQNEHGEYSMCTFKAPSSFNTAKHIK